MRVKKNTLKSFLIRVSGLVQGVGFRPFIYKIAENNSINGWVLNTNESVEIRAEAGYDRIREFIKSIKNDSPINSIIETIEVIECEVENYPDFRILKSINESDRMTRISPDTPRLTPGRTRTLSAAESL